MSLFRIISYLKRLTVHRPVVAQYSRCMQHLFIAAAQTSASSVKPWGTHRSPRTYDRRYAQRRLCGQAVTFTQR